MDTSTDIEKHVKKPLIEVADLVYKNVTFNLNLFYIGSNDEVIKQLTKSFNFGFRAHNLTDAWRFLSEFNLYNDKLPDAIFIDVPYNSSELEKLCYLINSEHVFSRTPIIYNEKQLKPGQVGQIKKLNIVDDIMNLSSEAVDYSSKIHFLKRSKREHQKLKLTSKLYSDVNAGSKTSSLSFKRVFDILISSLAIIFLLPLIILIAIAIRIESKGPIFYAARRAGKGFNIFKFYKFRSMVVDADMKIESLSHLNQYNVNDEGPRFIKIDNDPRITKVGKFLRNSSLDELPQLFNVLKGDMSIVGNRPLPIYEAVTLTTNEFVERFSAPAGITGLWQVSKRGKANMSVEERIKLDIFYSRNYNIIYDLKIIANTPLALIQKNNV